MTSQTDRDAEDAERWRTLMRHKDELLPACVTTRFKPVRGVGKAEVFAEVASVAVIVAAVDQIRGAEPLPKPPAE